MKTELAYYGGCGYEFYPYKTGIFEIKTSEDKTMRFTDLEKAVEAYEMINEDKALWDVQRMELLDAWYFTLVDDRVKEETDDLPF